MAPSGLTLFGVSLQTEGLALLLAETEEETRSGQRTRLKQALFKDRRCLVMWSRQSWDGTDETRF